MKKVQSRLSICIFVLIFSLTSSTVLAQSSPLNIRVVNVVNDSFPVVKAFLSLSDAQGFPITGLNSSAFLISEDNQPVLNFTISPIKNVDQPLAIVLVLDTSGSMTGAPLTNSVSAAKNFISTLMPNDQIAVISFANTPSVAQELTSDRDKITEALDNLQAKGDTALYDAVVEAIDLLKNRSERKVIVLLTDGKESGISQFKFDQVINEAARWAIPVYPIGFGGVNSKELDRLAILTGGFAQINPDSTALSEAFQNVLDNLREQYFLEYPSSLKADGLEHELNITVDYQNGTASTSSRFIAKPGGVTLSLPDLPDGKEVSGTVLFKPQVLAPAPLARLDISVDNQPITSVLAEPFEYTWDSTVISTGSYNFELIVTDTAGNSGSLITTLNVVPPVTVTTAIVPDQKIGGLVTIPAEIKAAAGVAKVEFFVDEQKLGEDATPPYEYAWDTTKTKPGYRNIRILATDLEDHEGNVQIRVNVEIQNNTNLLWLALITLLVALGVVIPIAIRRNKNKTKITNNLMGGDDRSISSKAQLIEKEGLNPGQIWPLAEADVLMGRKRDENDIPLKGLSASRRQAVIRCGPEGFVLISINTDNPMVVNGLPIPGQVVLRNGDLIQAGESEFVFEVLA